MTLDADVPDGAVAHPLPRTIERDRYTPALLSLLANRLVWDGSRAFRDGFGVGTNEWRILSAVANGPGSTAAELCGVLGMNKSIASGAITALERSAHLVARPGARGSRHLYLTTEGAALHDAILPVALAREEELHAPLTAAEVRTLQALLVRMLETSTAPDD